MQIAGRLALVAKDFLAEEEMKEIPCFTEDKKYVTCNRCGESSEKKAVTLPTGLFYCPHCIEMGRVDSGKKFITKQPPPLEKRKKSCTWSGELTVHQEKISQEMVEKMRKREHFLVHAVTGAGKTEMIFPAIDYALSRGKRIGIAVPRVDVCLELFPRLRAAFEGEDICLLHGRSEETFRLTSITICTTHQLLRFYQYFDFLIIDEVDAFPFVNNRQLQFAVDHSLKKNGKLIYLTATPTREIEKKMTHKALLPQRFHGKPLVEPSFVYCPSWHTKLFCEILPKEVARIIENFIQEGFPFLIFCPMIHLLPPFARAISKAFPSLLFETVSSKDKERLEKVVKMREGKVDCLITTTILERGVTFANISVLVIGSNHKVYTTSSLVQIGGRVGRKLTRTDGSLIFLHDGVTMAMKQARKQIAKMNQMRGNGR